MRVGILALLHESNTFVSQKTSLDDFQRDLLVCGEQIRGRLAASHHEVGGFFSGLADQRIEAVGIFAARAIPSGRIEAAAYDELRRRLLNALADAGPLDGLLAAPHGATVAEHVSDVDGDWLAAVRDAIGPHVPIVATLDPHANLSPAMVAATDAIIAYRTNPHIDQTERGREAAVLIGRTVRGEVRPAMAASFPPLAINIERQFTADPPCASVLELADRQITRGQVLANSLVLGFPYADVPEMGSATIAVTDNNMAQAAAAANELAQLLWSERLETVPRLIEIDAALSASRELDGPILLLDMGDNVGGGGPGDSTALVQALARQRPASAVACLCDPAAAALAIESGPGSRIRLTVGGKTADSPAPPIEDTFAVVSCHDGRFEEHQVRHGGFTHYDQGPTAVVRTDQGLVLLINSRRVPPFSLVQMTSCGIDPASFRYLVAKGVHAPIAAYGPIAKHVIRVNTPGVTSADMERMPYHHRRTPLFPFERNVVWNPPRPVS